ncbi:MAG: sigma-70 family RNA polymerase sigma factor [Acidobacteriota bacterium]
MSETENITTLLTAWRYGDEKAKNKLFELVYPKLRKMAQNYLRFEYHNHILQPTVLVHEAYLQLVNQREVNWQDRGHFYRIGSLIMRRILVEHARNKKAAKRGANNISIAISDAAHIPAEQSLNPIDVLALDEALKELAAFDERKSKLVELRYFADLSVEDTAEALGISLPTYHREWEKARAFLLLALNKIN